MSYSFSNKPINLFLLIFHVSYFIFPPVFAQKKIELLNANSMEYDEKHGTKAKRLVGAVSFKLESELMFCDSAYLYSETNTLDGFGRVHIKQGGTTNIYGDKLHYTGNTRKAEIRNNVRLVDKDMTLTTQNIDYDMGTDGGHYFGGGKIISKKNSDTLTSETGVFFSKTEDFTFIKNVVLKSTEYTIKSDTLKTNGKTDITYFFGPTTIKSKEHFIYCENGWHDNTNDISQFKKNAYLLTETQKISGDSMYFDHKNSLGKVFKNVDIIDTVEKMIINGDYAIFDEKAGNSTVTGNTMLTLILESDSLFLHSDTLKAISDSSKNNKTIYAYHHAKFYKHDLQGMCDSLIYSDKDSLIRLFKDPILWSEENQMLGEHISIKTFNGVIKSLYLDENASIISLVSEQQQFSETLISKDSLWFNQIKGRNMVASFKDNELHKVDVKEEGETLYFSYDDEGLIGVNKATSKDLEIYVKDNTIQSILFIKQPKATLFPIDELSEEELRLPDFRWEEAYRPLTKKDIFKTEKREVNNVSSQKKASQKKSQ